jgi:hypothetical protein
MHQAVYWFACGDRTPADAGAHRQINEILDVLCRSPAVFRKRRGIDVRVEPDGARKRSDQRSGDVGSGPAWFGRLQYGTVLARIAAQFDRAEGTQPDRGQWADLDALPAQARDQMGNRRCRIGGRKSFLDENLAVLIADRTNELRTAGFDRAEIARRYGAHEMLTLEVLTLESRSIGPSSH